MQTFRIGITGGIGSGKSHLCRLLAAQGLPVFSCDAVARQLMTQDAALRLALTDLVSPALYDAATGALCKDVMAAYLAASPQHAARVNQCVWPRVAEAWKSFVEHEGARHQVLVMECAVLFESGFDALVDCTVCVVAPLPQRLQRIMARDGRTEAQARALMALQMPEETKAQRADLVLQNPDGTPDASLLAPLHDVLP